jgi:hypothetical protein
MRTGTITIKHAFSVKENTKKQVNGGVLCLSVSVTMKVVFIAKKPAALVQECLIVMPQAKPVTSKDASACAIPKYKNTFPPLDRIPSSSKSQKNIKHQYQRLNQQWRRVSSTPEGVSAHHVYEQQACERSWNLALRTPQNRLGS